MTFPSLSFGTAYPSFFYHFRSINHYYKTKMNDSSLPDSLISLGLTALYLKLLEQAEDFISRIADITGLKLTNLS